MVRRMAHQARRETPTPPHGTRVRPNHHEAARIAAQCRTKPEASATEVRTLAEAYEDLLRLLGTWRQCSARLDDLPMPYLDHDPDCKGCPDCRRPR